MSRLDEIQARLDAATPGPWEAVTDNDGRSKEHSVWADAASDYVAEWMVTLPDADLVAHAPADLAALVAMARAVEAVADRIEPHANNLAARGDIETSVPLQNAVKALRDALDQIGGAS